MKLTWSKHEKDVQNHLQSICKNNIIKYISQEEFPHDRNKPDNSIEILDQLIVFDAKSPANEDLSNFPKYIKNQTENLKKYADIKIFELTNISINETLSRTIITSATTLLALLAIYFFGGEILKGFSLAMILGVVFGTYSSIYIANTVLVRLRVSQKTVLREDDSK